MISYEDFKKTEIKIGKILSAEKIPDTDKLLLLKVDFGTIVPGIANPAEVSAEIVETSLSEKEKNEKRDIRQIVSGIALYFPDPLRLVGIKCAFVTNLEPRMIRGYESNGMILGVGGGELPLSILRADEDVREGSIAK